MKSTAIDRPGLKLGVNIDHVATLREARYRGLPKGEPDPARAAQIAEDAGAHGITAHLREDRRHIQDADLPRLRKVIRTRFNLEMALVPEILEIALRVRPDVVCLVPERRAEVSTEGGLDVVGQLAQIRQYCERLSTAGIDVSLFVDPVPEQITASHQSGAQFVELHTGAFANHFHRKADRNQELQRLVAAAKQAHGLGLKVNAGHGLNVENVALIHLVPHLVELNIGHHLVSRSIETGLAAAVREMLDAMASYPG